jgi:hypothetical protein
MMLKNLLNCAVAVLLMIAFFSCEPDLSDDAIPLASFSPIFINTNLPEYQVLRTRGWAYINGGNRGIILYRKDAANYIAYERNCSYRPNEACATVEVHTSNLYIHDTCCGSTFDFATGQPTGGVAWRPLRQYEVLVTGSDVTITEVVIN